MPKLLEEIVFEKEAVKTVVKMIAVADRLRMEYGGSDKIDQEALRIMMGELMNLWKHFRNFRKEPGVDKIIYQITSSQAAIREIKYLHNPEKNFKKLNKHLEALLRWLRIKEKQAVKV
jgi:hypothetical protein